MLEIPVDFTKVDASFALAALVPSGATVQSGDKVKLVDDAGHRCQALVTSIDGGVAVVDLELDSWRDE